MYPRLLALPKTNSFFLFGARGVGKSTLLKENFSNAHCLWIDLLKPATEERYAKDPDILYADIAARPPENLSCVVIDEVQKIPRLLNIAHDLIETQNIRFILTGSSARKLKQGGANLLAGRAFVKILFPLSTLEVGEKVTLTQALKFGLLPKAVSLKTNEEKVEYLQSYTYTYLKEEIWGEQLVRKLDPFRRFLEVAAQCNGKIIHHENIAKDCGTDGKTVATYFSILEDTWLGMILEPFHHSFRKRLSQKPKFYFYDVGMARALARTLSVSPHPGTSYYGELFEQFIVAEIAKLVSYYKNEYRLSYLNIRDSIEIDLVVERPGQPLLLIEIKSARTISSTSFNRLNRIAEELNAEAICLSQDPHEMKFEKVLALPWQEGLKRYFTPMV